MIRVSLIMTKVQFFVGNGKNGWLTFFEDTKTTVKEIKHKFLHRTEFQYGYPRFMFEGKYLRDDLFLSDFIEDDETIRTFPSSYQPKWLQLCMGYVYKDENECLEIIDYLSRKPIDDWKLALMTRLFNIGIGDYEYLDDSTQSLSKICTRCFTLSGITPDYPVMMFERIVKALEFECDIISASWVFRRALERMEDQPEFVDQELWTGQIHKDECHTETETDTDTDEEEPVTIGTKLFPKFLADEFLRLSTKAGESISCPICQERVTENLVVTCCGHFFCTECFLKTKAVCALCRADLT